MSETEESWRVRYTKIMQNLYTPDPRDDQDVWTAGLDLAEEIRQGIAAGLLDPTPTAAFEQLGGCTCTINIRTGRIIDREAGCLAHGIGRYPRVKQADTCRCGHSYAMHDDSGCLRLAWPHGGEVCTCEKFEPAESR